MKKIFFLIFIGCISSSFSQVGIGTTTPDAKSILDIDSNSKGVLFPRLTDLQRNAISSPTEGLFIYNMDNHRFEYYNGTFWMALDAIRIDTPDLFISEYSEPSSGSDKYIEIYNPDTIPVTLTGNYSIYLSANGGSTTSLIDLVGIVAAGDVFVLYLNGASAVVSNQGDQVSNILTYNGNDAIQLRKGGIAIDQIGIVGVNPGTGWDVAGTLTATKDHVLKRKASVIIGTTNWTSSAGTNITDSQWIVLPSGDFLGLGSHP